jgi:hypothetical protein
LHAGLATGASGAGGGAALAGGAAKERRSSGGGTRPNYQWGTEEGLYIYG